MDRRDFIKYGLGAASLLALGTRDTFVTRVYGKKETSKKMLILGLDGVDPHLVNVWMGQGKLPAFRRLAAQGGFRRLETSIPPQSPVAWSNFIAGTNPGGHAIFDFIHRDPKTYFPVFSGTATSEASSTIRLGNLVLPLKGGKVENLRRGKAFWQILEEYDIPATIFKIPANYPPVPTTQRTLSGMGTPDLLGYYGYFRYYTTESKEIKEDIGGGEVHQVYVIGNRVDARIPGPVNTYKKDRPATEIEFRVYIDPQYPVVKITIQGQEFILREREWSGWKRIRFNLIPTQSVSGICMFFLKEVRPHFKLYVSPINIDPADAALPISTPDSYAESLEKRFGPFFTRGFPADTNALDNDVLDEGEFLAQDDFVLQENRAMLDYELDRFESGLLFYYFMNTDQRQHMFWRLFDEQHPAHDPLLSSRYGKAVENIYIEADRILDRVLNKIDRDTVLIVMSDHGFNSFRWSFNLNTWLKENGYHTLIHPWKQEHTSLFENTDWSRTKAYGLGLNGLYINEKGRETEGRVAPGAEKENLIREIARKLEEYVDPKTGERVIRRAFVARDVYTGPYVQEAPDIILGFNRGYRISFKSPLGKFPKDIIEANTAKWSGDHMGAPEIIPGILVANRKIKPDFPALYDVTATILDVFQIEKPKAMIGRTIF
ncbi:MAG: alkaline phosphatase family protein [Candidatus Aminicenantales bacterium]